MILGICYRRRTIYAKTEVVIYFFNMENSPQIELIDTKKKPTKKDGKTSKYRMGEGERKLPRPIVFWSENERDAFRRNKIVQTRYNMVMNDIENQKKASQKTHRHEAHKYQVRSGRIRQECQRIQNEVTDNSSEGRVIPEPELNKGSSDESDFENLSDDSESERTRKKSGMITKHKRPSVKFSVFKEYIPNDDKCIDSVKDINSAIVSAKRSLSASVTSRKIPDLPGTLGKRSQSTIPTVSPRLSENERPKSCPVTSNNKKLTNQKRIHTPNKLFFDKSVAAYELRKELQKLARLRKQGPVVTTYTMSDALRDEKERYEASQARVNQYIQKLDVEAKGRDLIEP